ncbi:hypothetical protein PLESTM_001417400 [Pleodorina starrii]|nr:hypothetical protein PLESTM_000688300 [Pleodorina starrii]GLC43049.1 hypothetical protein PLESTM_001417400 [Pleodorina starrii]
MESCSLTTRDGSFGSAASGSGGGMVGVGPGEGMAQLQPDGNGGWDLASGDGPLPSIQQQQLLLLSPPLSSRSHSVGRRMESCSLTTRDGSFGSAASGSGGGMACYQRGR